MTIVDNDNKMAFQVIDSALTVEFSKEDIVF